MRTAPPDPADPLDDPNLPGSIRDDALEYQQQLAASELSDSARCPLCRYPLAVRLDCHGPYFQCLCQGPRRRPGYLPSQRSSQS